MNNKTLWIVLTVLWVLAAIPSAFMAMMSAFMFDAPGSEKNPIVWALMWSMVALPVAWILGAGIPWIFYKRGWGLWFFAIPLLNVAELGVAFILLDRVCGGQFSCGK